MFEKKKKWFSWAAIVFILFIGLSGLCFAEDDEDDATGQVVKIVGKVVTVKDARGKEKSIEVKNLKNVKVGDNVEIEDNKILKINPVKKKGLDTD